MEEVHCTEESFEKIAIRFDLGEIIIQCQIVQPAALSGFVEI